MIKVLLVDDHDIVRGGIARLLSDERERSKICIIGEAKSGKEGIQLTKDLKPDIVLVDIRMPDMDGFEVTKTIRRMPSGADTKVIALSAYDDELYVLRLMGLGAAGFITKGISLKDMITAIMQVHKGGRYITARVAHQLALKSFESNNNKIAVQDDYSPFRELSKRELQVATMLLDCIHVNQIAAQLSLSAKTVNTYRYRIFRKLAISSDLQLMRLALKHGVITSADYENAVVTIEKK